MSKPPDEWSVRLAVAVEATDAQTVRLYADLSALHAAIGQEDSSHLGVQLTITGATLPGALVDAMRAVTDALKNAGLNPEIVEVEAMRWGEFERRLREPHVPELWGVAEAARHLGVSNQRINQLVAAYPDALPEVIKLPGARGARLWLADTWLRFAEAERRTGRPASSTGAAGPPTPSPAASDPPP